LIDALIIVALGMAIVFAVLAFLLGVMVLLNRFLKPSAAKDKQ